jgi:putative aminopeptidase FrvX
MLLKRLSEANGVSGHEQEVRAIILEEIRGRVDECLVDALGNLVARKKGSGTSRLKVLVAAHMDEVGLMITHIEDNGLIRFDKVGGIDDRILPARTVLIGDKRIPGVIAMKPVHLVEKGERDKVPESRTLAIDVGASTRAEAEKLVQRGDCAAFASEFRVLALEGSAWRTVQGKAFDDRAGCAILAELLKERYPFDLSAAFTVQEEIGLRGAQVAAHAEDPDAAFVLECTGANEVPTPRDVSPNTRIGQGATISLRDGSSIADPRLVDHVTRTAQAIGVRHQFRGPVSGGTDAAAIQRSRAGVAAITISVPARYIHSAAAILDLNDFDAVVTLAREALLRLPSALAPANGRDA